MNTTKEQKIARLLKDLGISPALSGYMYLKDVIMLAMEHPEYARTIHAKCYREVSDKYHTDPTRVERTIRLAIEKGCIRGNAEAYQEVFGYIYSPDKGKPTNKEFIATVADYARMYFQENV